MEGIIPKIIFNNEKIIFCKINKNNHTLVSENNIEYYRKEIMNKGFDIFCGECNSKTRLKNIPDINKSFLCRKCRNKGERNGMYDKKHSEISKEKISKKNKGKEKSEITKLKLHYSLLGKNKGKYDGKNNPMYNKKVYDIWVKKYGEEEANKKWRNYLEKLSKSSYFRTYNKQNNKNWSNISQELFWNIYSEISEKYKKIYFGELNHEYSCGIRSKNFDFVVKDNKKVIEFNGDKWHANPKLYEEKEAPFNFIGLTAKEIWEKDNEKINLAKERGYDVLIIWETDYKNNKQKEINKCINFINEKF